MPLRGIVTLLLLLPIRFTVNMVKIESLRKQQPINLVDEMVGTDSINPIKPVKNFTVQELANIVNGGWQFSTTTFTMGNATNNYVLPGPLSTPAELLTAPLLVPAPPAGKFIVINGDYALWQVEHEAGNPLVQTSGAQNCFVGTYVTQAGTASALGVLSTGGGGATASTVLLGLVNQNNLTRRLQYTATYGSEYLVTVGDSGSSLRLTGFGNIGFSGKATITFTTKYKLIDIN